MEIHNMRRRELLLRHDRVSSPRSPASTTCRVRVRNLASLVLHAGFAACFVLQVWDQVHRFLSREMVTVARDLVDQDLRFCKQIQEVMHNGNLFLYIGFPWSPCALCRVSMSMPVGSHDLRTVSYMAAT